MTLSLCALAAMTMIVSSVVSKPDSVQAAALAGSIKVDVNSSGSPTQPGFTPLAGNPNASITEQGVGFRLFGFDSGESRDRGTGSELLRDFAFNDGNLAGIGVRITNLDAGAYSMKSWHYDAGFPGKVQVELRKQGQTASQATVLVDQFDLSNTAPATYEFQADGTSTYEIVIREDSANNRARLNGFELSPVEPIKVDVNSSGSPTQAGFTALAGNPNASITEQGVGFRLFGFGAGENRDRGVASELLRDFAFNDGNLAGVGVRITNLPAGKYSMESWHYDAGHPGKVQVELRKPGQPSTVLVDQFDLGNTAPATYEFQADGASIYEIVIREDSVHNRARLNGFTLTYTGPADPDPVDVDDGSFDVISNDGVWTWFNDERAIFHEGYLFAGYVRSDGQYGITRYKPGTDDRSEAIISTSRSVEPADDHNNPSLTALPDGRLLAVYARHGNQREYYYRISLNSSPATIGDWGPEQIKTTAGNTTYANTYRLTGENNKIYNFYRSINFNPTLSTSTDNGQTWSDSQHFIAAGTGSTRPYTKYTSNDRDRIDMIYNDAHPQVANTSLYHLYYQDGAFRKTDGSVVKSLGNLPLQHDSGERGSVIYQYSNSAWSEGQGPNDWIPGGRAWTWDVANESDGTPVAAFQARKPRGSFMNDRIYYYYARWNGTSWQKAFIAQGGRPLYAGQEDYGGGMAIDPDDPNVVYISTNAKDPFSLDDVDDVPLADNQRYEIWKGVTADGGATFTWTAMTSNSPVDNLRPIVPKNHGYAEHAIWFRGRYTTYLDFDARVVGIFNDTVTPPGSTGTSTASCSGFCVVETFDDRINGSIRSQGDWQTNPPGATDGAIVTDTPPGPFTGKALMSDPNGVIYRGNAYKPLGADSIRQGETGTLFFQIYTEDLNQTYTHMGLSDLANPRLNDGGTGNAEIYRDFETQFTLRNGLMRVTDGGSSADFTNINPQSNTLYNVWLVVNNQSDTYEVYVQGGVHASPVKASVNGKTVFSFRNGSAGNDLQTFLFLNSPSAPQATTYIDNIHIDPDARNLDNPVTQFTVVDTFDALSTGDLANRNGWSSNSTAIDIGPDPSGGSNKVLKITGNNSNASKSVLGVNNGEAGTLFFRMRRDGNVNSSAGLSDVRTPANFGDFENQVNVQNDSTLNLRDGGSFAAVDTFAPNLWYCVWIVSNNTADTYQTYMKGGALDTVTRLDSGSQTTFDYRNGTTGALDSFFVRVVDSTSNFYIDDIHVDSTGANLATPTGNECTVADPTTLPLGDPIPETITKSGMRIQLQELATIPASSNGAPRTRINFLDHANDGTDRLFVNDLRNKLYVIRNGVVSTYLDVESQFSNFVDEPRAGTGFGFFAFHPDFATNGKFYTVHTEAGTALSTSTADYTSIRQESVHGIITEWTANNPAANTFSGSRRELLRIGFDTLLHGLQQIGFNPTANPGSSDYGMLYISVGDGEENPNFTNGPQNLSVPHGKILRIDPLGSNSPNGQYGIPSNNPFVSQANALGEVWAYGLRNPHRFSWDTQGTNKMFIGNIGEKNIDAIYPGSAGANFGWNEREGSFLFKKDNPNVVFPLPANDNFGYTYPVAEYDHDEGFAVVGGFVYRGTALPELRGKYVFGDLVKGRIFYTDEAAMVAGQAPATIRELTLIDSNGDEKSMLQFAEFSRADLRFGVDAQNEMYFLSKQNGKIWRMTSAG